MFFGGPAPQGGGARVVSRSNFASGTEAPQGGGARARVLRRSNFASPRLSLALLCRFCVLGLADHAVLSLASSGHRLVLAESSAPSSPTGQRQETALPQVLPGWNLWRQQVAEDKNEAKHLRQMLTQAEQDVEVNLLFCVCTRIFYI